EVADKGSRRTAVNFDAVVATGDVEAHVGSKHHPDWTDQAAAAQGDKRIDECPGPSVIALDAAAAARAADVCIPIRSNPKAPRADEPNAGLESEHEGAGGAVVAEHLIVVLAADQQVHPGGRQPAGRR